MYTRTAKNGFTLIELLVVISIIGLLSSVILASLISARGRSRDANRAASTKQVKLSIEFYFDEYGYYPSIGTDNVSYNLDGLATPLAQYIPQIPVDPSGYMNEYVRGAVVDNSYAILVYLEESGTFCKTGVNVNVNWWGSGIPLCPF